jgi:hypothetical protein
MRTVILAILLVFIQPVTKGQGNYKDKTKTIFIIDVFMKLDDIGLAEKVKAELLKHGKVVDGESEIALNLDTINNCIFIQSCFIESMTMPCDNYYLSSYLITDDIYEIVYSSNSVSFADKFQNSLQVFQYNLKTQVLKRDTIERRAFKLTLKDFFNENTPNKILSKYVENVNPIYSLRNKTISCSISDTGYSNTLIKESNLKASTIEIKWNGKDFVIAKYVLDKTDSVTKDE